MRPYNRSLHPDDYQFLARYDKQLHLFLKHMERHQVPHREWHPHRFWEYASIMQQLEELNTSYDSLLVDVGAGASFFDPFLALGFPRLVVTDNMYYGDITPMIEAQRAVYGVTLPLWNIDMQDMLGVQSKVFDVTMCISSIEHVPDHDKAFRELVRITKPGGYIFITSDYFRDLEHFEQSVSRHLQVTPYREEYVMQLPAKFGVEFVGDTDLGYKGDFVHNYSFCNICLRKR